MPRRSNKLWIGLWSVVLTASPCVGQVGDTRTTAEKDTPEAARVENLQQAEDLWAELRKLGDWNEQVGPIADTIERYWSQNGWNSEADQFAKRVAREVSGIPPWNFGERINKLTERVGERYAFTEAQRGLFQSSVYREAGGLLVKNYKLLFDQTKDFISMQAAHQPLTPELVGRWMHESEPLVDEARARLDRMAQSLEKTMTPEQRAILRCDLESLQHREAVFDQLRQRWADGGWEPQDWGLENDPLYAYWRSDPRQVRLQKRRAAEAAARWREERRQAIDETAWERYVRQFVAQYAFDEAQSRAAYSILRELQACARDYQQTHREEIDRLPRDALADHSLGKPIRRMFEELQARLEPIPTAAQRAAGGQEENGIRPVRE